ncbi:hypothetical protein EBF03_03760 [Arcanobacterium haemolyticum]|uniref:Uncharacterized protein n=1 Tax=Arcanobacterium haemolyticum (strain ATCC 9345 / DSM 20595 / CCM 5947 / CCUG 17215 / LMG 16163 / NBRC 15585 / NCTC 8452 / 11018) TaxID=644284 RepID=D7BNK0_ARCHD|nr:DUF5998 family protein [Arcanobacterium haemolyticum]ADH92499.1 conserved hypothetical protein [Arcanobacterium haemolyticum DSM 20595]QCX46625.1 hypothetical protein EBF03_03760 [Arcanobacterium haemolyticum]SQH28771.1 Uncharacterised protein [Arcanobacterium haemolyticum]
MNTDRTPELTAALSSLLPQSSFVINDVFDAVGDDDVRAFYVRPETMFDADSVYDRVVAFIATEHRLILVYTDTNYEMDPKGEFVTTMQSVGLESVKEHHVVRRRQLEGLRAGELNSVLLRLRWGSAFSQDLQPGACDDPACTNDHGYVGIVTNEDFQIFLDAQHDGGYFAPGVEFIDSLVYMLGNRR